MIERPGTGRAGSAYSTTRSANRRPIFLTPWPRGEVPVKPRSRLAERVTQSMAASAAPLSSLLAVAPPNDERQRLSLAEELLSIPYLSQRSVMSFLRQDEAVALRAASRALYRVTTRSHHAVRCLQPRDTRLSCDNALHRTSF